MSNTAWTRSRCNKKTGHVIRYLPVVWNAAPDRYFSLQNYNFPTNPQGDGWNSMATNCHWLFVLHELPLMYHELSLIVFGGIASGCGWLQQPCHADAGLCDGGHLWLRQPGIRPSQYKTLHCISGCGRVVPWLRRIFDFRTLMYHPSFTHNDNTLVPCRHCGLDPQSPKRRGEF